MGSAHLKVVESTQAAAPLAFTARLKAALCAIIRGYHSHRAVRELARWDDRMLADIGLARSDVTRALMAPPNEDPTRMLANARRKNIGARYHRI